jgi:hypothetical protein
MNSGTECTFCACLFNDAVRTAEVMWHQIKSCCIAVNDDQSGRMSKEVVKCNFQILLLYLSRKKTKK